MEHCEIAPLGQTDAAAEGINGTCSPCVVRERRQASVMAAEASNSKPARPEAARDAVETVPTLQYSLLLEHLVGDKRGPRQARAFDPASLGGFPAPAKSDEQKMVERVMESCGFKATLACVGGG